MPSEWVNDLTTLCSLEPNPEIKVPLLRCAGWAVCLRKHVERISLFTTQVLNYSSQGIKSRAENDSGGVPEGSQTTTALPAWPSVTLSQGRSSCRLLSEPPDNIRALWEISRIGPTALFMDLCVCVFLCVNACLHLRENHVISHKWQRSFSLCMHVKFRREGGCLSWSANALKGQVHRY